MKENLCIKCKTQPVHIKKRGLCKRCYEAWKRKHGPVFTPQNSPKSTITLKKIRHSSELEFVKNYFGHKNWLYECTQFKANGTSYTPDFYDGERNVFIELVGSRQGFHERKEKIEWFKKTFPKIPLEVRTPDGALIIDEPSGRIEWPKPERGVYF